MEAQVKVVSGLITHKFYIAGDVTGDGILGMDFLKPLQGSPQDDLRGG